MVYFALRDENWGTYAPHLSNETLDVQHDSFRISYQCHHENAAGKPRVSEGNRTGCSISRPDRDALAVNERELVPARLRGRVV